jgi:urease accessory protein
VLARLLGAWRTGDAGAVDRWTAWLQASRPTRETRDEDRQLGAALARTLAGLEVDGAAAWTGRDDVTLAAMFALAAARFEIPTETALTGHAFAWAEAITSAAVRLVPLGQTAGQRLLAAAGDAIPAVVARALALEDDDLGAAAPGQALASAQHETLYSRLFRS